MRRLLTLAVALFLSLTLTGCTDEELTRALAALEAPPTAAAAAPSAPASSAAGGASSCATSGFGGVKPGVAQVGHHIQERFGIDTVFGVREGSVAESDHPRALALDFMVYTDRALGDQVAAYVLANRARFGVTYVIWRQRIHEGAGWDPMEDRGGVTANHYDHVHVSFRSGALVPGLDC